MSNLVLHPCSVLSPDDPNSSYAAAIHEDPNNAAIAVVDPAGNPLTDQPRLLTAHSKYWMPGRTLKIKFVTPALDFFYRAIFDAACEWLPHINLKFVLAPAEACEIRIALDWKVSASAIGTDAMLAYTNQSLPTMGFDVSELIDMSKISLPTGRTFPRFDTSKVWLPDFKRIVLHEFGHVLGAEHEHQHPDADIPWDEDQVIKRFAASGVSEESVRWNMFRKLNPGDYAYSAYDPASIMHYDVPNELTRGDFKIDNRGKTLSSKDIEFMRAIYPPPGAPLAM